MDVITNKTLDTARETVGEMAGLLRTLSPADATPDALGALDTQIYGCVRALRELGIQVMAQRFKTMVPGLRSISWEISQEYDDEGNFPEVIDSVDLVIDAGGKGITVSAFSDDYDLDALDHEDLCRLAGVTLNASEDDSRAVEALNNTLPGASLLYDFAMEVYRFNDKTTFEY